jgi:hypothetical protein
MNALVKAPVKILKAVKASISASAPTMNNASDSSVANDANELRVKKLARVAGLTAVVAVVAVSMLNRVDFLASDQKLLPLTSTPEGERIVVEIGPSGFMSREAQEAQVADQAFAKIRDIQHTIDFTDQVGANGEIKH